MIVALTTGDKKQIKMEIRSCRIDAMILLYLTEINYYANSHAY